MYLEWTWLLGGLKQTQLILQIIELIFNLIKRVELNRLLVLNFSPAWFKQHYYLILVHPMQTHQIRPVMVDQLSVNLIKSVNDIHNHWYTYPLIGLWLVFKTHWPAPADTGAF